jgi:flagellar FliL protein
MADDTEAAEETPKKKSKLPILIGLVLMLGLGGGGFYAVYSGMLLAPSDHAAETDEVPVDALPDIAYVPLEPVIVSLDGHEAIRHLRFTAQLEVPSAHVADVTLLQPRVLDVLNTYLRAVDAKQFEDAAALITLRAQILRRIQLVVGEGRVRDVLITEFVIN